MTDPVPDREAIARIIEPSAFIVPKHPVATEEMFRGQRKASAYRRADTILRSLPSREAWQPIETAPKDGTRIQLLRTKLTKFPNLPDILWIKVGSWRAHFLDSYENAWREDAVAGPSATDQFRLSPSHWMPLPEKRK